MDCFEFFAGIHLWVLGQADVSWSDKPGGRRAHFEFEIYIKDCLILWGRGKTLLCYKISLTTKSSFYISPRGLGQTLILPRYEEGC